MSAYVGDFRTGKTVRKMWNSNAIAGESITRSTNGTISVYKDGGTTQSTTGVTDTEDFDSLTGVHLVAVDTSADGTFYSAGSDFEVVLSAATIDGKTINATLFSFSLENRSALMPTTAGRTLDVTATGEAGLDFDNTAGTLAKGTDITGFNDLAAADVRTAVGLASANLDTQLDALPTAAEILAAILAGTYEGSETVQGFLRLAAAALFGKASGLATTTAIYYGADGTTARVTATVDADGNRSAVTRNA